MSIGRILYSYDGPRRQRSDRPVQAAGGRIRGDARLPDDAVSLPISLSLPEAHSVS